MNTKLVAVAALLLIVFSMLAGCASPPQRGTAYGREREFRQLLTETVPVKDYGYTMKNLRFTSDYKRALVIFTHPNPKTRPDWEFSLKEDEFGRYEGLSVQPFPTPDTSDTPMVHLTITLPRK